MASHVNRPLLGIMFINVALIVFACNEALVRYLTEEYSPIQIAFIRFAVMILLVGATMVGLRQRQLFVCTRWGLVAARGVLSAIATAAFFYSLKFLSLDDATTVYLSAPIFVALFAGWFLGERVSKARWAAILIGFCAVAYVMQPGGGLFNIWAFLTLLAALTYAVAMLINRALTRTEDSLTILFYMSVFGGLTLVPIMPFVWTSTPYDELPALFCVGLLAAGAQYCLVQAYRFAAANTVIVFDYMGIIYIAVVSYAVFAEVPSWQLIIGATVLIASGLFVVYDETRQLKRMAGETG